MKSKRKIIIALVVAIAVFTLLSVSAMAASQFVSLSTSQTSANSAAVGLSHSGHSSGYNYNSSARDVYLILQHAPAGSGWSTSHTETMTQGESEATPVYSATGDDLNWRTQLNPVGWGTKNCTAYGYVYDY